jgi:hypothetical protein
MRFEPRAVLAVVAMLVVPGWTSMATGGTVPVENWVVVVDGGDATTVTDGTSNSPTFMPADQDQIVGGFDTVSLADGDFIKGDVSLTLDRTASGGMGDNVRFALFREDGGGNPTAGDGLGYTGVSFALQNALRDHRNPARAQPFSSGGSGAPAVIINPAGVDPEADSVTAQNVTLHFTMTITRDGNALDISGSITDGADYTQSFTVDNHVPDSSFTTDVYSWNRMGFLFANAVNGNSASLDNARVRSNLIVPEPASAMLMVIAMAGCISIRRNRAH